MDEKMKKWTRVNLTWVRLNCTRNHVIAWTSVNVEPEEGIEQWCKRCTEMAEIAQVIPKSDLRIVACDDCKYVRNVGVAKNEAGRRATNHCRSRSGHVCRVYDGDGKEIQRSRHEPKQETLNF